jgi:hypothetical protein
MERRWTNPSQPQTLQIAVWLLYFNGVLGLVFGTVFGRLSTSGTATGSRSPRSG